MAFEWRGAKRSSASDDDCDDGSCEDGNFQNRKVRMKCGSSDSDRSPHNIVLKNSNNVNITPNGKASSRIISGKHGCKRNGNTTTMNIDTNTTHNMNDVKPPFLTPVTKCQPKQPVVPFSALRDVHDLTKLEYISIENVLECLKERYRCHQYYTYAGPVLLSLNSCLRLPRASLIEDITSMTWFIMDDTKHSRTENETNLGISKSPHVYDVGYRCLRNLVTVGSHQIILISGESGAGKTTATQQLIRYLTENNSRNFGANICSNLDKKIYFATIILESFGNAKTQANPNSSRFGRLVQLNYNKVSGQILGAEIQTYLLEKHRVAKYDVLCERNFHIFYYIFYGLKYGTIEVPNVCWKDLKMLFQQELLNDALEVEDEEVQRLVNAVQAFNMTDFSEIMKLLLAIVSLLNVSFVPDCDTSSEEEHYSSGLESPYKTEFTVSDKNCVRFAAELLGINESELVDILVARKITAGSSHRHSIFRKPCENSRECEERLHALTSFIYDRLFSYVLEHLNYNLKCENDNADESEKCYTTLSLLDLYGFENFHSNHLEQICINYANERLQQINVSIVKSYYEQSIPQDEVMIPPTELIRIEGELCQRIDELHTHVFAFLDEECLLKRSSEDKHMLEKLNGNLMAKKSKFIKTSKLHESEYKFTVVHYATKVEYQLKGLVQKNKDHIPPEFQDILKTSTNAYVTTLFKYDLIRSRNLSGATTPRSVHTISNKNSRGKTILTRFKQSVEELMTRLRSTEDKDVNFIRCIRPNPDLLAGTFSSDIVEKQLHACGIADVVKIAGNGYPIRLYTTKFMTEFPKLLSYFCDGILQTRVLTLIFCSSKKNLLKFGNTMVFMSEKHWKIFKKTEQFLTLYHAKVIQKAWRSYLKRKEESKRTVAQLGNSIRISTIADSRNESSLRFVCDKSDDSFENLDESLPSSLTDEISQNSQPAHITMRLQHFCDLPPPPPLYYGIGIVSRTPLHTLPIKVYTKRSCLPFAEKPPKRLLANGIQDAFEDYGIILFQT